MKKHRLTPHDLAVEAVRFSLEINKAEAIPLEAKSQAVSASIFALRMCACEKCTPMIEGARDHFNSCALPDCIVCNAARLALDAPLLGKMPKPKRARFALVDPQRIAPKWPAEVPAPLCRKHGQKALRKGKFPIRRALEDEINAFPCVVCADKDCTRFAVHGSNQTKAKALADAGWPTAKGLRAAMQRTALAMKLEGGLLAALAASTEAKNQTQQPEAIQ